MNIFSFFAGAGFLDLGFELQGKYNIVFVNEFYKPFNYAYQYARKRMGIPAPIYGHHVENILHYLDGEHPEMLKALQEMVNESKKKELTGFIGGPPCPDFSVAGRNKGQDGENGRLSGTYCDLICKSQPDFFLFENVKGLYRTARHRAFFEELKQRFINNGYYLTEQLINSLEYGAPQDRDRIILLGFSNKMVENYNLETNGNQIVGFPWEDYKSYDLKKVKAIPWPTTSPYNENVETAMPEGIIPELTVLHWWQQNKVENHPNHNMYFQPRAGLIRFQTKDEGDIEKKCYKRLHRWRYSPTAAYGNNEVHIHPFLPRRISASEALAIQSLPANFILPTDLTLTEAFKTIGNGVPFVAAKGIASSLYDYIHKHNTNI